MPNVRFLGFLSKPEIIYHLANFTLHPARYEPFGQIISESLACNVPVLVSEKVGAKEIVTPKVGQVLHSFQPQFWAETIKNIERSAFEIPEDFVYQNELSLEQHVDKMLRIFEENKT